MTEQTPPSPTQEKPKLEQRLKAVWDTLNRDKDIFVSELFGSLAGFGIGAIGVAALREKNIPQDSNYFGELLRKTGVGRLVEAFRTGEPPVFEDVDKNPTNTDQL